MSDVSIQPSDEFLTALGRATYAWAYLETVIDSLVAVTFHSFGGQSIHPEIPKALSRKLEYLKDCSKLPALKKHRFAILALKDAVNDMKELRHDVIHGAVSEFADDGTATLMRFVYEKQWHRRRYAKVTAATLVQLTRETARWCEHAMDIASELMDLSIEKDGTDPAS